MLHTVHWTQRCNKLVTDIVIVIVLEHYPETSKESSTSTETFLIKFVVFKFNVMGNAVAMAARWLRR